MKLYMIGPILREKLLSAVVKDEDAMRKIFDLAQAYNSELSEIAAQYPAGVQIINVQNFINSLSSLREKIRNIEGEIAGYLRSPYRYEEIIKLNDERGERLSTGIHTMTIPVSVDRDNYTIVLFWLIHKIRLVALNPSRYNGVASAFDFDSKYQSAE